MIQSNFSCQVPSIFSPQLNGQALESSFSTKDSSLSFSISLTQNNEEEGVDEEMLKKKTQNKVKYRKLKQKLLFMCNCVQDKCVVKENKQISSPNKSRILKLGIEFQKAILHQTKDYQAIESKLKEIQKILDHKRQHDLLILKQSRFIPTFSYLLKQFPAFHKNQYHQSLRSVELGLKILKIFCTLSSNRDYMISTNQISILNACLGSFLGKQERKLAIDCIDILHHLLCSRIKAQLEQIVQVSLEIIFLGQLGKKIKLGMENCLNEDGICDEEFLLKSLKYIHLIEKIIFEKYLDKPIYHQPQLANYFQNHFDTMAIFLQSLLVSLLLDKDNQIKEQQLPICIINLCFYLFRLLNMYLHLSASSVQSLIKITSNNRFILALKYLFEYSKQNYGDGIHELNKICSEIMIFLGKLAYNSDTNRQKLRQIGFVDSICNHPLVYLMDNRLKCILIPALCSIMNENIPNMKKFLNQSSPQSIIQFVEEETKSQKKQQIQDKQEEKVQCMKLNRKESVSSLNSYTTQCTSNSYKTILDEKTRNDFSLTMILPSDKWNHLIEELMNLDQ